ncbi:INO80 complex subunit B-like conserved region domain-containing protein [Madurella fahalii]|uniref:INO80 complex subunit B-like conserved region domain-containing protein n=1 Tax=Madurella fahalii TaxID=1157608 RepID=A0ABQ0GJE3_9PEZI
MAESPFTTPKRKRSQMLSDGIPMLNTTTQFTFDLHSTVDDGNSSPRSRVAHRFRGLALSGGGGGGGDGRCSPPPELSTASDESEDGSRKRRRVPEVDMTDVDGSSVTGSPADPVEEKTQHTQSLPTQSSTTEASSSTRQHSPKSIRFALDVAIVGCSETAVDSAATEDPLSRQKSPDRNKPRNRASVAKRAGTPPLTPRPKAASDVSHQPAIADPLRASLTWHDDEITIYDPDDSDDDGTGINGIGFKPTPAIAYARTVRRKQQLAEYRKREEREARAKRSQRRRGSPAPGLVEIKGKAKMERRRVRFLESAAELIGV